MKCSLSVLLLCLPFAVTGCASKYGVAEIRYMDYSSPSGELVPQKYFEHARAQHAGNTLYVEGRVVDDFCNAFQWRVHEKDRVTAPETVIRAVVIVPERENSNAGRILLLDPREFEFIGIHHRDGEWGRVGTDFPWTPELVKAWNRLLDQASAGKQE